MSKNILIIIILALIVGGLILGKSKRQEGDTNLQATSEINTSTIANQAEEIKTEAANQIDTAQQQAKAEVAAAQSQIQELISKAQTSLQSGNYEEAIQFAQQILSQFDANSTEAKDIIAKAKAKIQELAQQKINDLKNAATNEVSGGLKGTLGNLGK